MTNMFIIPVNQQYGLFCATTMSEKFEFLAPREVPNCPRRLTGLVVQYSGPEFRSHGPALTCIHATLTDRYTHTAWQFMPLGEGGRIARKFEPPS